MRFQVFEVKIALHCGVFFMINFHLWQVDFEKYIHNT